MHKLLTDSTRSLRALLGLAIVAGLLALGPTAGLAADVRVGVLPWKVNAASEMGFVRDAMLDMLSTRVGSAELHGGGTPRVVRSDLLKETLGKGAGNESADAAAARVGKALKLDYVLYGSLTVLGESLSLDAKLLDVGKGKVTPFYSRGKGLDSVLAMSDKLSAEVVASISGVKPGAPASKAVEPAGGVTPAPVTAPAAGAPEGGFIVKSKKEARKADFIKSKKLDGAFLAAAVADLDRDGTKEIFLLEKSSVVVGLIEDGAFRVLREIKTGTAVINVSITAVDSDGDGSPEVYVSGVSGERASSFAVEHTGGEYRVTITGIDWLLRAVRDGSATTLIGQSFRARDGMYGDIRELRKEGSMLVDVGPYGVELPKTADLYRFALFNFNSRDLSEIDLVVLDDRGRIRVYREVEGSRGGAWDEYWRSDDEYGGTLNVIAPPGDSVLHEAYEPVPVEGSFYYADLDGDGSTELIVKSNVPGGLGRLAERPRSFKKGTVVSVKWDGEFLTELWRTREVQGYIADFFIEDLDGDGAPEMTMVVTEAGGMLSGGPKSYILSFDMSL